MKKILLLFCALLSLNGIAQSWDFKTSQALGGWSAGTQTLSATIVTDGVEITWDAAKTPKLVTSTAGINVANDIMAVTVINNSTEPIAFRAKFPRNPPATGNKFYRGTSWDIVPTATSTATTYYFDLSGTTDWSDYGTTQLNTFELQIGDQHATSNTNIKARDNASTSGNTIIIGKIEFIDEIPAAPGTITSTAAGDWDAGATWVGGVVPASVNDVVVNHAVRVRQNVTAEMASLTVGSSPGQLRIDNNSIVKVTGEVDVTRTQDGIAFYAQAGQLGSFTYGSLSAATASTQRMLLRARMNSNNIWSLVSTPFNNSRLNETISVNGTNSVLATNGTNIGLAYYDDSRPAFDPGAAAGTTGKYVYYQTTDTFGDADYYTQAKGYSVRTNNADNSKPDIIQRGVLESTFPITIGISDAGNGFNLIGNPLIGYLNVNDGADGNNNILRVNGTLGADILEEDTIWLWDASANGGAGDWVTHNRTSTSYKMPGVQGFFVKAKSGGGTFSFTKAMQADSGDAFLKSSDSNFSIDLSIASGENTTSTSIKYISGATASFDNGYDSSTFSGYGSSFEVYTNLLGGESSKRLAIQSLPNSDYDNMVIPVGLSASTNSEVTFKALVSNLPEGYEVYLEDRLQGTFTRLDELNSEYNVTISGKSTDGRFFLHTKSAGALSTDNIALEGVGMYTTNKNTLRVTGVNSTNASVKVFNIIGKQVLSTSFSSKGVSDITLPNLNTGVYIVELNTERGKLNKKIVLE